METLEPRSRIEEIESILLAYKNGWIAYDRNHVLELQSERAALLRALVIVQTPENNRSQK